MEGKAITRCGVINCNCGQQFYFKTVNDEIACIKCKKVYDTTTYPEKVEIEEGEGEPDGAKIRDSEEL